MFSLIVTLFDTHRLDDNDGRCDDTTYHITDQFGALVSNRGPDLDGDGAPDCLTSAKGDEFPLDANETDDTDGDATYDTACIRFSAETSNFECAEHRISSSICGNAATSSLGPAATTATNANDDGFTSYE